MSALEILGSFPAGRALLRSVAGDFPRVPAHAMGLSFAHPIGVAAGFDKNARAVLGLQELGFSFVEIGTVTPRPQPGNHRPRLWRFPDARALVNSLGFPGDGMTEVRKRLDAIRRSGHLRIPVGVNLGKNKDTLATEAVNDYLLVLNELYEPADYFVVNVSSPNTPGLRDLQALATLRPILEAVSNRSAQRGRKPVLLKISPDLADDDVVSIGRLVRELSLAGIVAANTTIRRELVPKAVRLDRGGLSGPPLLARTQELIKLLRPELATSQTLIASGGVASREDVSGTLNLGADLIQIYTAFIYLGPRCVRRCLRGYTVPYAPPQ